MPIDSLLLAPSQWFANIRSAIVAFTSRLTRFDAGSASGSIVNAVGSQMVVIQSQAQAIALLTRAATSFGADLTSFVAQFFLNPARLPATFAGGSFSTAPLVCGRNAPSSVAVFIPAFPATPWPPPLAVTSSPSGVIVQNTPTPGSGAVQYGIVADLSNPNYNVTDGGYFIPANESTVEATVKALVAGTGSNLLAGELQTIVTPGQPFDYIQQPDDITNGVDEESDPALRVRFRDYISGLAKGTISAIDAAVASTQAGLSFTNNDRLDQNGNPKDSFFTIVADDGSGAIPQGTLTAIATSIDAGPSSSNVPARSEGIGFAVIAPSNINVGMALSGTIIQPGFNPITVRAAIAAALVLAANTIGVGGTGYPNAISTTPGKISYFALVSVVQSFLGSASGQGLAGYTELLVNGGTADIPITAYQLPRSNSGIVSVT